MTHPWLPISGGVSAHVGFLAAATTAGLKASGKPDLALIVAPEGAVCAGTFTTSVVRAACVDLCAERLQSAGGRARAVLTNSGQANACTGDRGLIDSQRATQAAADRLGLAAEQVLICSTGVIGVPIAMDSAISISVGGLLTVLGWFLDRLPRNFFVGIRTPWTIVDADNWTRTHRLGKWLFIAAGLAMIVGGIMGTKAYAVIAVAALVAGLVPMIYSYLIYRQGPGKA